MPGFMPGIHVFFSIAHEVKSWMAGISPAMTHLRKDHLRPRQGLTSAVPVAISTPPGTSGLLAFEMEIGK
jgi:hypothetical protein